MWAEPRVLVSGGALSGVQRLYQQSCDANSKMCAAGHPRTHACTLVHTRVQTCVQTHTPPLRSLLRTHPHTQAPRHVHPSRQQAAQVNLKGAPHLASAPLRLEPYPLLAHTHTHPLIPRRPLPAPPFASHVLPATPPLTPSRLGLHQDWTRPARLCTGTARAGFHRRISC